ncbi:ATP12 family chaperone protein [Aerobium aerolatum]|uniref:Chaperone required for the assembly of the F1-ATPase n=1 Tax=Aquamicrobium aerolatum DSM 21857 TaxID=1121003 RepID=A0A1I3PGG1_9HYPH|nr:ATP12 family protein [Aquamicrobium aerolatum]SFJ20618.1 Chaperone required for the assembly of the F1-ATPase [Aquamicrobium aerolatum DSM 21857]
MRDQLEDIEAGRYLSDPDPVKRAQIQMRQPLPKRFYKDVTVTQVDDGFSVQLDGKPVRTPGKALLAVPTQPAAELLAAEFDAQQETINPVSMPVVRLVNTAIDGVATDLQAVLEDVMRFSGSDLVCYRADAPQELVQRQADAWDPILDWAQTTLGARFILGEGIMHVAQPREAVTAVGIWLKQREDAFRLSSIHLMTSLTGSALIALAVEAGAITPDEGWKIAHVDEDWTNEHWGEDAEATARRIARRKDFDAAVALADAIKA